MVNFSRRSFGKSLAMLVRRLHLVFGLFLLPWAILYGITAFLFNHPTALSEQPTSTFGPSTLVGTSAESMPSAEQLAEHAVAKLNEFHQPPTPFVRVGEAKFNRELAFATVKQDAQTIGLVFDVRNGCGTVRVTPNIEPPPVETPPFAVGVAKPNTSKPNTSKATSANTVSNGPQLTAMDSPPHERFHTAIPTILERTGYPAHGTIVVTSVPEVVFPLGVDERTWFATYNPMTGTVGGSTHQTKPELGWRRFVLRLHTAHGYPGEVNARWLWALVVDVMAFVMCFWGVSGVVMWWQMRSLRRLGTVILLTSAVCATTLGFVMYRAMMG
jgi:hypothetical protein